MNPASPFLELDDAPRVQVTFDGASHDLPAALLAAGVSVFRNTPVSGAPRGPFCMMGACFDCLVDVDGVVRQACMMEVTQGLKITRPQVVGAQDDQA